MRWSRLFAVFAVVGALVLPSQAAVAAPIGPRISCTAHGLVNTMDLGHITLWVETNIRDHHAVYSFIITMVNGKRHTYIPSFQFGTYSMPRGWNSDEIVRVDAWEAGTRCVPDYRF